MVFTDADAKDEDRQGEVTAAALAKNIKITTVLTGNCSGTGRKRRDIPGMSFRRLSTTEHMSIKINDQK